MHILLVVSVNIACDWRLEPYGECKDCVNLWVKWMKCTSDSNRKFCMLGDLTIICADGASTSVGLSSTRDLTVKMLLTVLQISLGFKKINC